MPPGCHSKEKCGWGKGVSVPTNDFSFLVEEVVDYIADHNNVLYDLVNRLDQKTQNHIQDSIERLMLTFHSQGFSNDLYHVSLIQALAALAGQGKCIILGHGGTYALQAQPGLHIRITASLPVRIARLCRRWGITRNEAEKIAQSTDKERWYFIRHHFMADPNETKYFHLVLNTDRLAVNWNVSAILGIMQQKGHSVGIVDETLIGKSTGGDLAWLPAQRSDTNH